MGDSHSDEHLQKIEETKVVWERNDWCWKKSDWDKYTSEEEDMN